MKRSIHASIKSEYDRRQKTAYTGLDDRRQAAYVAIPGFEAIDSAISSEGIKYNKMILSGEAPAEKLFQELLHRIGELKLKREALLVQSGFPHDYLELSYYCSRCRDTGIIQESGIPTECICYKQQLINHIFRESNLRLSGDESFQSFDETLYPDTVDQAKYGLKMPPRKLILEIKERCMKFINNFLSPDEKNLFFTGRTGVGKTFMAGCVAIELMHKGVTVLYQTAPSLFNIINEYKMNYFKGEGLVSASYKGIFEVELLIIDDLGTEPLSSSRYAELLNIINTRQSTNLIKPCKTIIATNIGVKELYEYYDERVASRIIGCFDMFRFVGEDIRSLKKLTRLNTPI